MEPKMYTLSLPNGTLVSDARIVENTLEKWSNGRFNPSDVFGELSATPKHAIDEDIMISDTGLEPILVTGDHPSLHYRGHALKRHKIWEQTSYAEGLLKYGYTGWQHSVAAATRDVAAFPVLKDMMHWLNAHFSDILKDLELPPCEAVFNHAIFTRYEDQHDFIGMHADKEIDFVPGSYFVIFKLGEARDFAFSANDSVFWQRKLPTGTAIIVKIGTANQMMKHGVPTMQTPCGPSGSIVFRCIETIVPWPTVRENIERSKREKVKRKERKRKKQDPKGTVRKKAKRV